MVPSYAVQGERALFPNEACYLAHKSLLSRRIKKKFRDGFFEIFYD